MILTSALDTAILREQNRGNLMFQLHTSSGIFQLNAPTRLYTCNVNSIVICLIDNRVYKVVSESRHNGSEIDLQDVQTGNTNTWNAHQSCILLVKSESSIKEVVSNKLIAEKFSLTAMGNPIEAGYEHFDGQYRGWQIWLDVPNGGILSVDILHYERRLWLGTPTYEQFGYDDDEGIINFAKNLIDRIETFIDSL